MLVAGLFLLSHHETMFCAHIGESKIVILKMTKFVFFCCLCFLGGSVCLFVCGLGVFFVCVGFCYFVNFVLGFFFCLLWGFCFGFCLFYLFVLVFFCCCFC